MSRNKKNWKDVPYITYSQYRVMVQGVEDRPKKRNIRVQFPDGRIRHVKV